MTRVLDVDRSVPSPPAARRRWLIAAVLAVLGLVVGAAGVWLVRGDTSAKPARVAVVGGAALTSRQQQMVDMHDRLIQAMRANDGATVASLFNAGGVIVFTKSGQQLRLDDGTLKQMVDRGLDCYVDSKNDFALYEPVIVNGELVMSTGSNVNVPFTTVTEFTPYGDLKIDRHEITW